jgi:hypothetical protein
VEKRLFAALIALVLVAGAGPFASATAAVGDGGQIAALVIRANLISTRVALDDLRACAGCPAASLRAEVIALRAMKAVEAIRTARSSPVVEGARAAAFEGFRSYGEAAYSYGQSRYYSNLGEIKASLAEMRTAHQQLRAARSYTRKARSLLHIRISRLP